jgi:DNA-binding IscR family transcriptional regulator
MIVPMCVEITVRILDVIKRGDVEYVPGPAICKHVDCNEQSVITLLSRLTNAGILESRRGPTGGYKQPLDTNLLELFLVAAPSQVVMGRSLDDSLNKLQKDVLKLYESVVFKP